MLKKLLALLLALVMVFSLAACGSTEDDSQGDNNGTNIDVNGDNNDNNDNNDNSNEGTSADNTDNGKEDQNNGFSVGTIQGNRYESDFIGLAFSCPPGWTMLTAEQIQQRNEQTLGMIGDDYAQAIQNASIVYEMAAASSNQTDNISINLEKLSGVYVAITAKEYLELSEAGLKQALQNMGMIDVETEIDTVFIAGQKRDCVRVTAQYNGIPVYEVVAAIKCGEYIANIAVATWNDNVCDQILGLMQAK